MARHWAAVYLPAHEGPERSRFDFPTKRAAWKYVFQDNMCKSCKAERQRVLNGKGGEDDNAFPGCSHEWLILKTADYDRAEGDFGKMMDAAGGVKIWSRGK